MQKKGVNPNVYNDEHSNRQRILTCAANLFASKGFTEATIRELAEAVGLNAATIYYYFPSKNAILEHMLEEYLKRVWGVVSEPAAFSSLRENPTPDGIMASMLLSFPEDNQEYYLNVLKVLLHEQHRNPDVRHYVAKNFMDNEAHIRAVFDVLKELNIIRQDADPDLWMKISSSLLYTFSNRMMLGIGDRSPGYSGKDLVELLRDMVDLMLKTCGV